MKRFKICIFLLCLPMMLAAANYYVATGGNDSNLGTIEAVFQDSETAPPISYLFDFQANFTAIGIEIEIGFVC